LLVGNSFAANWYTYYELYPDPVVTDTSAVIRFKLTTEKIDDYITMPDIFMSLGIGRLMNLQKSRV